MTALTRSELTLITVHYNTAELTIRCLTSILAHLPSDMDYQLVVVDNASEADQWLALNAFAATVSSKRLHLIRSRVNTGFGWGNMMGIQDFPANHYLFINSDTLIDSDVFTPCLKFINGHPQAAACGIQIVDAHGKPQISFDHFASPIRELVGSSLLEKLNPNRPRRKGNHSVPTRVDYVNGSFLWVRAREFEGVGGFDPHIFLYYEETDLCLRLHRLGLETWFLPGHRYIHIQNASVRRTATGMTKKKELKRSYLYITRKHYGLFAFIGMWTYFVLRYSMQCLVSPRYWSLLSFLLRGAPLHETLRLNQHLISPGSGTH